MIEDDADISRLLGLRLRSKGHEVTFASDAVTATTVARKVRPDLILLDLGLPGGGGLVIMERLNALAELSLTPVIVVSARVDEKSEAEARAAGAAEFVEKPIDTDTLDAAIDRVLAG